MTGIRSIGGSTLARRYSIVSENNRETIEKEKVLIASELSDDESSSGSKISKSDVRIITSFPKQNVSAKKLRSKLFHSLGLNASPASPSTRRPTTTTTISVRPRSVSFHEDLKADHGRPSDEPTDSSMCSSLGSCLSDSTKSVSFDSSVLVHTIPSRTEYSDRIRPLLWTPVDEMQENAARNCVEYASEGWDWRTVLDDESMILVQGERIHPVHFAQSPECTMRRRFMTVLAAQQAPR